VQAKTRKLKKYWEKLCQAKSDIKDLQAEFQIERDKMLKSIRNLNKQLKMKELIISQFLPPEAMSRFGDIADGGRASWNEDEEMWVIPRNFPAEAKTRLGDIVTGERAVVKIQCAQRFQPLGMWRLVMGVKVGAGCGGWRWVRGMPLDMICGVGQEGACFVNSLMGRCSRLP
jgi:hypothetical protein